MSIFIPIVRLFIMIMFDFSLNVAPGPLWLRPCYSAPLVPLSFCLAAEHGVSHLSDCRIFDKGVLKSRRREVTTAVSVRYRSPRLCHSPLLVEQNLSDSPAGDRDPGQTWRHRSDRTPGNSSRICPAPGNPSQCWPAGGMPKVRLCSGFHYRTASLALPILHV